MSTPTKPNQAAEKAALTEAEAAKRYNLSQKTFQNWRIKGGGPKFIKMGKAVRYLIADLEAFEAANKFTSTSQVEVAK